jgi:flagellar motor switch protein FliM
MAGGGLVVLGLPLSVLSEGESTTESDGAMAAAMEDVEIDVVAELGKVRVPLSTLSSLAVGDVLQLPLSLDDRARVCAGGAVLFRGRPTAIGLTIGVAIERHGT